MKRTLVPAAILTLLLAGCQVWVPGGTSYTDKNRKFTLTAPTGWHYRTLPGPIHYLASLENPLLQSITVEVRPLKDELPMSKRKLTSSLSPLELSEALIDNNQADQEMQGLQVLSQGPVDLNGTTGVRFEVSWHTSENLPMRRSVVACLANEKLYLLTYTAPARHYYGRDLMAFDSTVRSFRIER